MASEAKETLDMLMATAVNAVRRNDEEGAIAAGAGLATFSLFQLIRVADAMEKLAGLMDVTVSHVAEVAPPAPEGSQPFPPPAPAPPYFRPECSYSACPSPHACMVTERCHAPAGWAAPPPSV